MSINMYYSNGYATTFHCYQISFYTSNHTTNRVYSATSTACSGLGVSTSPSPSSAFSAILAASPSSRYLFLCVFCSLFFSSYSFLNCGHFCLVGTYSTYYRTYVAKNASLDRPTTDETCRFIHHNSNQAYHRFRRGRC